MAKVASRDRDPLVLLTTSAGRLRRDGRAVVARDQINRNLGPQVWQQAHPAAAEQEVRPLDSQTEFLQRLLEVVDRHEVDVRRIVPLGGEPGAVSYFTCQSFDMGQLPNWGESGQNWFDGTAILNTECLSLLCSGT